MYSKEQRHQYYLDHKEKELAYARAWHAANPEKAAAAVRLWNATHPVQARAQKRAWKRNHPEERRVSFSRRRAKKLGNGGSHTAAEWVALCWSSRSEEHTSELQSPC